MATASVTGSEEEVEEDTTKRRKLDMGMVIMVSDNDINDVVYKTHLGRNLLQRLFHQLGITTSDIEYAERMADTRDFKLQSIQVLHFWRQSNGEKATRKAIINALIECNLIEAKEMLVRKWTSCPSEFGNQNAALSGDIPQRDSLYPHPGSSSHILPSRAPYPVCPTQQVPSNSNTTPYYGRQVDFTNEYTNYHSSIGRNTATTLPTSRYPRYQHHLEPHTSQYSQQMHPTEQSSFLPNTQLSTTSYTTGFPQPVANFPRTHFSSSELMPSIAQSSTFPTSYNPQHPPSDSPHMQQGPDIDYYSTTPSSFKGDPQSTWIINQAYSGPHRHLQPNQPPQPAPHLPQIHHTSQLHSHNYSSPQSSFQNRQISTGCAKGLQQPMPQFHHQARHVTGEGVPSYPVQSSSSFDLSNVSHRVESDYPPVRQVPEEQLGAHASSSCYHHPLGRNTTLQQQAHVIPPTRGPGSQGFRQNSPQTIPAQHTHQSQSLSSSRVETSPTTSSRQQVYTSPVFNLAECKTELVTYYRHEMRRVQLLPWCDESRDMNDIYVTLKLQNRSGKGTTSLSNNEALVCIKSSHGEPETRILLKGVAGSGKSTLLAKLAYTWAEQKNGSPLSNFELLFILSLREVRNISLIDELFEQIFESNTKVSKDGLEEYIESHPQSILLLLDGFDEYSASDLSNPVGSLQEILIFKSFRDCYTILSTRPHKDLQNHQSSYVLVDVLGFSRKNVELYMKRFFSGNIGEVRALKEKIEESERLIFLSKIPVILMLMCLLWEDEKRLPDTQTELYQEFVLFLWRKYCKRWCKTVDFRNIIDGEFGQFILGIGQVALDGLCSENNIKQEKLVFTDNDFGNSFQLGCETGLLSRERLRSRLSRHSTVTFLHKSFQEFCAAKYWASLYTTDTDKFSQILSRLKPWTVLMGNFEFAKFCCGLVKRGGVSSIIQHAISLYRRHSHPKDICVGYNKPDDGKKNVVNILTLLYENDKTTSDCDSNVDSFNPKSSVSQQCQDKSISRTECSMDPPRKDCEIVNRHTSGVLKSSLTQTFKLIFPDDGFTIAVANKYPKAISIFHNFVRSELGLSILSTVKSISFDNPHLSPVVVGDTLRCMSIVSYVTFKIIEVDNNTKSDLGDPIQSAVKSINFVNPHLSASFTAEILRCMANVVDVKFEFSEVDNNGNSDLGDPIQSAVKSISFVNPHLSACFISDMLTYISDVQDVNITVSEFDHIDQVGVMLTDKLGKLLYKLSKFEIQIICDIRLNVNVPLHHLFSFTHRCNYTHIRLEKVSFAVFNMNKLLSGSTNLRLFVLKDISITLDDMDSPVDEINDNLIEYLSIEYIADCNSNDVHYNKDMTEPMMYTLKVGRFSLSKSIASAFFTQIINSRIQVIACANNLRKEHIKTLSEYLSKASNLQMLNLSQNNVGMAIGPLAKQLQYCTKLTSLNLSNARLEEEHIKILSEFLPKVSNLQNLNVSANTVGMAIECLAQQLQHCAKLTSLNLSDTQLKEEHITILSEFLHKISNLQELNVSKNTVGMAIESLAQQLQYCTKLTSLNLHYTQLQKEHIKILNEFLPKVTNLQELNVSENIVGLAIESLAQQLQYCTKLTSLNLRYTQLQKEHIKILSEFLHKVSNLQELNVSMNNVGMAIVPLAQELQFCPMLSKLNLHYAHITDEGVIELSQRFVLMPNLTHLDFWSTTCFGNHAVDALFKHIHHLTKLQYLVFASYLGNRCSDRVKDCLAAIGKSTIYDYIEMNHEDVQLVQNAARKYL
ncbi:uncharacterized protein [Amphiura filiformis]|uniref:uncharacterized protein n=1 Tax=Amphiura filiformis TaxID=82378 RepID=UPI003B22534C